MSRSGYSHDYDNSLFNLWRGAVDRAIAGKRGQAFLREMLDALDAMPDKRLIDGELIASDGSVCAIGSVGLRREIDMTAIDYEAPRSVAGAFGIAPAMVAEIEWYNDEFLDFASPEDRWLRMRRWVASLIIAAPGETP